ncbi:MAG TPA: hypothetical protein EYH06_01815 [Chromatiales bacterium]|nr:hypothetical protein [Chromatiales bacterium]
MNEHLAPKMSGFCVANLRNSLLLRAIRRLEKFAWSKFSRQPRRGESQGGDESSEHFEHNLLHPELIRGSLSK